MDTPISVFGGSGFIGSHYLRQYGGVKQLRDDQVPATNNLLTFVSTVDNYNIFSSPTLDILTNQVWLVRLLENSRAKFGKDFTINFISSWFVYGDGDNTPRKETDQCNPKGFYAITKYAAELMLKSYCETYDIPYRIFRLSNIMGVGDTKASLKKNAIQYMVETLMDGGSIEMYTPSSVRSILDVRDCVRAIDLLCRDGEVNQVYNIGHPNSTPVNWLMQEVQREYGGVIHRKPPPDFHSKVQAREFWMDVGKLIHQYGFYPTYQIWDTLGWIADDKHALG